jgi:YVTN family beta-propeller protein
VISCSTNQVIKTVNVGVFPSSLAYDSASNSIYVANTGSNSVSVISGSTNNVITTINVSGAVDAVAYDPTSNTIYAANEGIVSRSGNISSKVSVISGATNQVIASVTVGVVFSLEPEGITYDSSNNTILVANCYSNNMSIISGSTNKVIGTVRVGNYPDAVAFDPKSNTIYVVNMFRNLTLAGGSITIIYGATTNYLLIGIIVIVVIGVIFGGIFVIRRGKKKGDPKPWHGPVKEQSEEKK